MGIWGILKIFLFWRLGLFVVTYLGTIVIPPTSNGGLGAPTLTKAFDYWLSWAQWDGGYFMSIAQRGYLNFSDFAFFPLYPIAIKFLTEVTPLEILTAGLLIANLSFAATLAILYLFLQKKYSKEIAFNSTITLLCFPTAFFAVSFYSEGLFLLLTVLIFYFFYQKKLLVAAILVSIAAITRLVGVALIISTLYQYISSISFKFKNISTKILIPIISAFGILGYSIYLAAFTNDPLKFISTQAIWQRSANDPLSTIFSHFWIIIWGSQVPFDQYFDLVITVTFLTLLIYGTRKISSSLWIFSTLVILIPASSGTLTSMSRYALSSLGAFVIIGQILRDHPRFRFPIWSASLLLQAILAVKFIGGYWVA